MLTGEGARTADELARTLDAHAEQSLGSLGVKERRTVDEALAMAVPGTGPVRLAAAGS